VKGKLTPKESFILYGVWIVAAFALFVLGLYWGKGQATGLGQEITTQPVAAAAPAVPRAQPRSRLDLLTQETAPPAGDQQAASPVPSPRADGLALADKPPAASPGARTTPPKALAPASSPGKEVFSIQVGALNTEEEARKVMSRLEARGYAGILDKPVSKSDPFYRVRVGNYSNRRDAARAEALLKDQGFVTFIKKVK
jgi:cell division septation protein DedD